MLFVLEILTLKPGQKPQKGRFFYTTFQPITWPRHGIKAPKWVKSCSLAYSEQIDHLRTDFGPIFFSTFFRQKNSITFGFFSIWGVKFVHEKVEKSKILPNPILIITNVFSMFLGFLRHPTIGLTPRLAHFMAILLNLFFFHFCVFGTLYMYAEPHGFLGP